MRKESHATDGCSDRPAFHFFSPVSQSCFMGGLLMLAAQTSANAGSDLAKKYDMVCQLDHGASELDGAERARKVSWRRSTCRLVYRCFNAFLFLFFFLFIVSCFFL
jgi:hypothetical protein